MEQDKPISRNASKTSERHESERRIRTAACCGLLAIATVVIAGWAWYVRIDRPSRVPPPAVEAGTLYPEVATLLNQLREAVLAKPRDGEAWGQLGMAFVAHELFDASAICFAEAERFAPNTVRWPYLRGAVLEPVDKQAALACYRRAVEFDEVAIQPRLNSAEILLDLHRLEEAESTLFMVLRYATHNARAEFLLGRVNLLRGDLRTSLRWALLSAEHRSGQRATHELLVQVYHRLGEDDEVSRQQEVLQEIPPGMTFWDDPFIEEAMTFRRDPHMVAGVAGYLLREGNDHEAIRSAKKVVAEHQQVPKFHEQLVQLLLETGKPDQAVSTGLHAAQLHPRHPGIAFWNGRALRDQQDLAGAVAEFQRAVILKPDYAAAFFGLGECLRDLHDHQGALLAFRTATGLEPELLAGHLETAKLLLDAGEKQQAGLSLDKAASLAPEHPEILQLRKRF
ncbi:MAG TPA: tetratricopeptide repeat protein [Pirellulaceae bacterium]|jgi:tetratricopeptide (TPR) repeat protein|nr:tetratricopeptide repeat protein [Pirellulaceae bacterium]